MSKYRSKFEAAVRKVLPQSWKYEPMQLSYTSAHKYTPDFVKGKVLIEVKGRFRSSTEARKYIDIRNQNPEYEIVFVFMDAKTYMPNARPRKNGTKRTQVEWAESHGFDWYTIEDIGKVKI